MTTLVAHQPYVDEAVQQAASATLDAAKQHANGLAETERTRAQGEENRLAQRADALSTALSQESAARLAADAERYTKSEVDRKIAAVQTFDKVVVQTLPAIAGADDKTIYLVPRAGSETPDLCDEYVVIEESGSRRWEKIGGGTAVDITLDDAVTKASARGVKSSGIWSALWGALAAVPAGFASLYDWVVAQLALKYAKPAGGIPASDLAQMVQTNLAKAGTAVQSDDADFLVLKQFYLEEKRKADPRFGVADNVSVVIGEDGNRYEVVTEGEFIPTTYGQGVHAKEIYLAPSVNAIMLGDDNSALSYAQKIVCYGNITSISTWAFLEAYKLNFLSLAGLGQTDTVANGNVDFSMCNAAILVVIPDTYYQDETSAFWNWADYAQDAGGVNYLRMCNFAKASNPRRNPYIVETSYALSSGAQEKYFIIPDYQWDVKWAKRWGEDFLFPEGEEIGSIMLNDICGVADVQFNNQATLSNPAVSMGTVQTFGANCPLPSGFDSHYGGATIEVVVSGFNGYAANVDFGGMKIEGRTLQILDPSGNEVALSANSIGEGLSSFVFRASRVGASFQWLLNLGRAIFTTPDEWADMGDYDFISDGMSIACDNGQAPFYFHALRIYNAILTDAQIMEHARLDAERFNLTEEI